MEDEVKSTIAQQTLRNTIDIEVIKNTLNVIQTNHLHHIEKDMDAVKQKVEKVDAKIDKVDSKIYYILIMVVAGVVLPLILRLLGVGA